MSGPVPLDATAATRHIAEEYAANVVPRLQSAWRDLQSAVHSLGVERYSADGYRCAPFVGEVTLKGERLSLPLGTQAFFDSDSHQAVAALDQLKACHRAGVHLLGSTWDVLWDRIALATARYDFASRGGVPIGVPGRYRARRPQASISAAAVGVVIEANGLRDARRYFTDLTSPGFSTANYNIMRHMATIVSGARSRKPGIF